MRLLDVPCLTAVPHCAREVPVVTAGLCSPLPRDTWCCGQQGLALRGEGLLIPLPSPAQLGLSRRWDG